jgi:hypothetical protein
LGTSKPAGTGGPPGAARKLPSTKTEPYSSKSMKLKALLFTDICEMAAISISLVPVWTLPVASGISCAVTR